MRAMRLTLRLSLLRRVPGSAGLGQVYPAAWAFGDTCVEFENSQCGVNGVDGEPGAHGDVFGGADRADAEGVEHTDLVRAAAAPSRLRSGNTVTHEFDHLVDRRNADGAVLANQPMASGRRGARHRPGDGPERAAERS